MAADLESGASRCLLLLAARITLALFLLALWTGEFFVGLSAIFKSQEFLATIHFMDSRRCW
jgi:hypothetical protein